MEYNLLHINRNFIKKIILIYYFKNILKFLRKFNAPSSIDSFILGYDLSCFNTADSSCF